MRRPRRVYPSPAGRLTLAALCALTLLVGCAAAPSEPAPRKAEPELAAADRAQDDPRRLLDLARAATGLRAQRLVLDAAMRFAALDDPDPVRGLLRELDDASFDAADRFRRQLLMAWVALRDGDPGRAGALVDGMADAGHEATFDVETLVLLAGVRAETFDSAGRTLAAARERLYLDGLLAPEARAINRERLWSIVVRQETTTLEMLLAASGGEQTLTGWLELALIARGIYPTLEAQQRDVLDWRRRWPDHMAAHTLPKRLARLPELIADRPRHVALLLPLSGPLASAGSAIRDGFMAAHLQALRDGGATPRITVFDTHETSSRDAYVRAVDAGAELAIGPLSKSAVDELATLPFMEIPILALNTTTDPVHVDASVPFIQFALLPEDDGVQIAQRAREDGAQRALILMRDAPWSTRVADAFTDSFGQLGGEIVATRRFGTIAQIREAVAAALLIDESEERAAGIRRLVAGNLEFTPRRRRDIDTIIVIVDPASGRTLKPALDYYFARDLPVYASSHINDGSLGAGSASPLDGIRFCDMPWRLLPLEARARVDLAWPNASDGTTSFHALGFDAWRLHAELSELNDPRARFSGVTGELALTPDGRLRRELQWALIRSGRAQPLPRMAASSGR